MSLLFGCYSGNVLREMTHLTNPWKDVRKGLTDEEYSERIIDKKSIDDYFKTICKTYHISSLEDIKEYSLNLFKEAMEVLNQ